MQTTIKSGGKTFTFFAPNSGGYVRHETGSASGTLAQQICDGGTYLGNTLRCGATEESLKKVARGWLRQRTRKMDEFA
jgi:adenosylmethionine-8-amino-7-oxononanoate aminotransferase